MNESFFDPMPRVVAHRGDSAHFPENTLSAFLSACTLGVDVIETDVHLSKDGELVIWHDETLDRNTDGSGRVEDHTLSELKTYDAGYMFTADNGKTYPFRGKGVQLCTLREALEACPYQRFNVDLKSKDSAIVDTFIEVIHSMQATERIVAASFRLAHLKLLRKKAPDILTSITTLEVVPLLALQKLHLLSRKKHPIIFQVPVRQWGIEVITPSFIRTMHSRGSIIQVWTINEEAEMKRLFQMGVDSVMTDKPALAIKVAAELGL
ncbi:MAG: glycerophosphoryl diester phosphodiesterase [Sphaerochaeta sp.]|jgi:glycerophosphoryl diester phosphodiesterase|uniref:Glycerophosphodiester phosphodiesterase n=1 Tax=Sphaerochaeta halotolerans TaxID=2293840 RepID=A0A372MG53_9SPIR|nr:glycerophosphodiester phosphodiesterase [Sphaerochaeta halotolerans]MDK2859718.1 glycerophosphoryl diester phosphodiesterase [Sphaerochaeta sp.]MDN5334195.1 glycerophosphoryl diester phosphodiesterase [Sphaerochaeta sp.]RFU94755.1 glycerophosphodiester phosphodiesterase [Sphaerochaeta halotolerans]